jgi:hypothetical protein
VEKDPKGETEPDNDKVDPGPKTGVKEAAKTAYKRADIADPFALQTSVQAEYDAAMKRSYRRASTGKDDEKGKVGSGT